MERKTNKPWVTRLPQGLQEQPGWVFIGTLIALAGTSYLLGVAESTAITRVLDPIWLRVWGGFLAVTGTLVIGSTLAMNRALEKLSLRCLSLGLFMYGGWIIAAVPITRAALTLVLCLSFMVLAEIRIAVIKVLFKLPAPDSEGVA